MNESLRGHRSRVWVGQLHFLRLTASSFLALSVLAYLGLVRSGVRAATPTSGTISLTTTSVSWKGFSAAAASPDGETTCVEGTNCDTFTLTLAPGNYMGLRVRVKISWSNQINDYDLYAHNSSGTVVASSTNGPPETSEETTFDINTTLTSAANYTIHTVYFSVLAGDPYAGTATLETIPPPPPGRVANYVPGNRIGLAFSRSRTVVAHGAVADGEPSARVDFQGNAYAGAIRGLSGGDDLWRFDLNPTRPTYDPFLKTATPSIDTSGNITNPAWKGQPDAISPAPNMQAGGDGGGDMDLAVGFKLRTGSAPGAPPPLALTSLVLANVSAQTSADRGDTYNRNPAGQTLVPVDDRNWMEFLGGDSVYLAYRQFTGLQATVNYYVNRSDDAGFSYQAAVVAGTGGNTTFNVDVDQNDGTVYFCHQGPGAQNNQVQIAVGHPVSALAPPVSYTTYVAATGQTSTIAALFASCKVAPDGTVYVAYSDGGTAIFLAHSFDQGKTWAPPVRVSNLRAPSTSVFPWLTTGNKSGAVGIAWYGNEGPDSDDGLGQNNDAANWKVFYAESLNATAQNPTFYQAVASDHFIHGSNISLGGFGGTANRNLLDFFQLATDPQGLAFIAYADDSNDFNGNTYVMHQSGGLSLHTGNNIRVGGTDRLPPFDPNAPQVIDERHDARVRAAFFPQVPDADTPVDILTIQYGCDVTTGPTLITAKMRLSGLTTIPPEGIWRINFASYPSRPGVSDHADQWFLQASTNATDTQSFQYGTAVRNSGGGIDYTARGNADYGAFNVLDSSITMKVDIAKLNALETRGLIKNGTTFIGLRGSASIARTTVAVDGVGVGVGLEDVTRGGTHYTLDTSKCVGATGGGGGGGGGDDEDEGEGEDSDRSDRDDFKFHDHQNDPSNSDFQFNDRSTNLSVQGVGALRSISYNGSCVSFSGDALVNGKSGYTFAFSACDLSATGTGIGTFNVTVTGPPAFLYTKAAAMTSGYVKIHPH